MRLDRLRTFALSLPHTTWVKQWGEHLVFKIGGKMFLIVSLDGDLMAGCIFKCTPADYSRLIAETDGAVPAGHNLFKSHWVELEDPDALSEIQLTAQVRRAYELVKAGLPRKIRGELH